MPTAPILPRVPALLAGLGRAARVPALAALALAARAEVSVTLTAPAQQVVGGQTLELTWAVAGADRDAGVTWAVLPAEGDFWSRGWGLPFRRSPEGRVSFHPPAVARPWKVLIRATSRQDPSVYADLPVEVLPGKAEPAALLAPGPERILWPVPHAFPEDFDCHWPVATACVPTPEDPYALALVVNGYRRQQVLLLGSDGSWRTLVAPEEADTIEDEGAPGGFSFEADRFSSIARQGEGSLVLVDKRDDRILKLKDGRFGTLASGLLAPAALVTTPEGAILFLENLGRIRELGQDGELRTRLEGVFTGARDRDGHFYLTWDLEACGGQGLWRATRNPHGLARRPDGTLLFTDNLAPGAIRTLGPDGTPGFLIGPTPDGTFHADRKDASGASIGDTYGPLAVTRDGAVVFLEYRKDTQHFLVRRITPDDRLETLAGGGQDPLDEAPVPARQARFPASSLVAAPWGGVLVNTGESLFWLGPGIGEKTLLARIDQSVAAARGGDRGPADRLLAALEHRAGRAGQARTREDRCLLRALNKKDGLYDGSPEGRIRRRLPEPLQNHVMGFVEQDPRNLQKAFLARAGRAWARRRLALAAPGDGKAHAAAPAAGADATPPDQPEPGAKRQRTEG